MTGRDPSNALENTIKTIRSIDINDVLRKYDKIYTNVKHKYNGLEDLVQILEKQTKEKFSIFEEYREDIVNALLEGRKKIPPDIIRIITLPAENFREVTIHMRAKYERARINVDDQIPINDKERELLRAFLEGLWLADGTYNVGFVSAQTTSLTQAVIMSVLLTILDNKPSVKVAVDAIRITKEGVKISYYVGNYDSELYSICKRSKSHECKEKVINSHGLQQISKEAFLSILYGHILGDGSVYTPKHEFIINDPSFPQLVKFFKQKLELLGFKTSNSGPEYRFEIRGESAVSLAEAIKLSMPTKFLKFMAELSDITNEPRWNIYKMKYKSGTVRIGELGSVSFCKTRVRFQITIKTNTIKTQELSKVIERLINNGVPTDAIKIYYGKEIFVLIDAKTSMLLVCCNHEYMNRIIEIARHSDNQNAKEWDDVEKVRQKCWRYFQMYGLRCDNNSDPAQRGPGPSISKDCAGIGRS